MAEVAVRSRRDAERNPYAQLAGSKDVDELLAQPYLADPLRRHDCAPITDGAAVIVLAADDRARELVERPAWISGIAHVVDSAHLGARDLTTSPSTVAAARAAGIDGVEIAELQTPFTHQELLLRRELGLGDEVRITPSGGALAGNPMFAAGLVRIGEAAAPVLAGDAGRTMAHATSGPALAAQPGVRHGGTMKQLAAVLGTGQTHHKAKRPDVSMAGLCREAIDRAMVDAQVGWDDIDAVVVGKAPDFFEGVMMPELFLADALGAVGKPLLRVHTAGSVGGSTGDRRGEPRRGGRARAGAGRGVGEAVGVERHVGAVDPDPVQHAGQRRGGRLLRAARAQLHPALGRAQPHRGDRRGEGPAQRRQEPLRPPAPAGHHGRVGAGVADAVGPDPLRRDLPVVGRRLRGRDRRRNRRARRRSARLDPRARRCARSPRPTPGATR